MSNQPERPAFDEAVIPSEDKAAMRYDADAADFDADEDEGDGEDADSE